SVIEFCSWDKCLFTLGQKGVFEHRGGNDFHLKGWGAGVCIFDRNHLPLLGYPEAPSDRTRRLRRNRLRGRCSATAHRTAPPVKKPDWNAAFGPKIGQPGLCLRQFPIGRKESAILV